MIYILNGPTGCGKTYQAFNRLNKKAKAIYLAPCRQLVYESAMKYGNSTSHIATSDIKIGDMRKANLSFRTYECCSIEEAKRCDVLIIDEAHFMSDKERGTHLSNLASAANKAGKKVILLSATMNFKVPGAKVINLPARGSKFQKREISMEEAFTRAKAGIPTLVFHARRANCGYVAKSLNIKGAVITAETSVQDRIRLINLFNSGKINLLEATNAMAQGVNVPCENMILYYNGYDDPAVMIQKMGRLGRTGVTRESVELTYAFGNGVKTQISNSKTLLAREKSNSILNLNKINQTSQVRDYDLLNPSSELDKIKTKNLINKSWRK